MFKYTSYWFKHLVYDQFNLKIKYFLKFNQDPEVVGHTHQYKKSESQPSPHTSYYCTYLGVGAVVPSDIPSPNSEPQPYPYTYPYPKL